MPDYNEVYEKWWEFISQEPEARTEYVNMLDKRVQDGFNLITQIVVDELKAGIENDELNDELMENLEFTTSILVYSGYFLYLIENSIDPESKNESHEKLVEKWLESVAKEQEEILEKEEVVKIFADVNHVIRGLQQLLVNEYMNRIILLNPDLSNKPYHVIGTIESYFTWAVFQAYRLAHTEDDLNK